MYVFPAQGDATSATHAARGLSGVSIDQSSDLCVVTGWPSGDQVLFFDEIEAVQNERLALDVELYQRIVEGVLPPDSRSIGLIYKTGEMNTVSI